MQTVMAKSDVLAAYDAQLMHGSSHLFRFQSGDTEQWHMSDTLLEVITCLSQFLWDFPYVPEL